MGAEVVGPVGAFDGYLVGDCVGVDGRSVGTLVGNSVGTGAGVGLGLGAAVGHAVHPGGAVSAASAATDASGMS